jgi:hypothetical protein
MRDRVGPPGPGPCRYQRKAEGAEDVGITLPARMIRTVPGAAVPEQRLAGRNLGIPLVPVGADMGLAGDIGRHGIGEDLAEGRHPALSGTSLPVPASCSVPPKDAISIRLGQTFDSGQASRSR